MNGASMERATEIARRVEDFVRREVIPYERDARRDHHGAPTDELVIEPCGVRTCLMAALLGTVESSMAKVSVSEALMRVADRCVQVMGGTGVSGDTVVEQIFREIRAFRIYDGPTEVHKWSLTKTIKREWGMAHP